MNISVCVKQVPDTETKIKLTPDSQGVDLTGAKFIVSPYDEFAIEEALRLRDKNPGSTVTIYSAGPARATEAIRTALAMGANNGIHVELSENSDNHMAAQAIAAAMKKEAPADYVFTGKEAIDDGAAQTSQMIAEHLSIPCITVVLGAEYSAQSVKCRREIEGGAIEVIEAQTPVLIAAQKGLNEPRYASLPNIMKAKKKEIKVVKGVDLGVTDSSLKIKLKNFEIPPARQSVKKLTGDVSTQAQELVQLLRNEAKVI